MEGLPSYSRPVLGVSQDSERVVKGLLIHYAELCSKGNEWGLSVPALPPSQKILNDSHQMYECMAQRSVDTI